MLKYKKVMIKRLLISICFCLFFINSVFSQLTYTLEIGYGISPYGEHNIAKTFNGGIGYTFLDELLIYGGINFFRQGDDFYSQEEYSEINEYKTNEVGSFIFQGGIHNTINLKTFVEDKGVLEYRRIGVFPDVKFYFNPFPDKEYKLESGKVYTVPRKVQFAYGLGVGIFYGSWKNHVALKYEFNTIDNLKAISKVVPDLDKNSRYNHIVSLVFVFK